MNAQNKKIKISRYPLDSKTKTLIKLTSLSKEISFRIQNEMSYSLNRKCVRRRERGTMNIYNPFKKFGFRARERVNANTGPECVVTRWDSLECVQMLMGKH